MKAIGADIGGPNKGIHLVCLNADLTMSTHQTRKIDEAAEWILSAGPAVVAIDAPCLWSASGKSRSCERSLRIDGQQISCFSTPTQAVSEETEKKRAFYGWVRNGMALFSAISESYPLYLGKRSKAPVSVETFPQAVACYLDGKKVSAKAKGKERRRVLVAAGLSVEPLRNIDLVDAALCALAGRAFLDGEFVPFGTQDDGFIVVPREKYRAS